MIGAHSKAISDTHIEVASEIIVVRKAGRLALLLLLQFDFEGAHLPWSGRGILARLDEQNRPDQQHRNRKQRDDHVHLARQNPVNP